MQYYYYYDPEINNNINTLHPFIGLDYVSVSLALNHAMPGIAYDLLAPKKSVIHV